MIAAKCFEKDWLDGCRREVGRVDPGLLEKSLYAFELLGRLAAEGLPFVFKGDTALLLLLDRFRRLSIDVDIACAVDRSEVDRVVKKVVSEGPFTGVEQSERDPARLPRRYHYTVQFSSVVYKKIPASLQLDILEDAPHYQTVRNVALDSRFLIPEEAVEISVPSLEGLLADKLTAFAPATVGIPYGANKASIKIVKQMSDIGELFLHAQDGVDLRGSYEKIFSAENGYRNNAYEMSHALRDTIDTARLFCEINLKGYRRSPESEILLRGVSQVDSHMIGRRYILDEAKVAASRAAHLAALIHERSLPEDLSSLKCDAATASGAAAPPLTESFAILERLRQVGPEAIHHWQQVLGSGFAH